MLITSKFITNQNTQKPIFSFVVYLIATAGFAVPYSIFAIKLLLNKLGYSACVVYILKQLFTSVSVKVGDIYLDFGE